MADGTSDRVLTHVIGWAIRQHAPGATLVEPGFVPRRHAPVAQAIDRGRALHGHDLVIVHRDAEAADWETRATEIAHVAGVVRIIPVRMTEAWLLGDETAIRLAGCRQSRLKRLKRRLSQSKLLVAEYTESFEHLRELEAYQRFEADLTEALRDGFGVTGGASHDG